MTQAFNLSQFANFVNSSGKADLTTAVTGTLPVGNGGTGSTGLTQYGVVIGGGSSALGTISTTSPTTATAGDLLVYQGSGLSPIWKTPTTGVNIEIITTTTLWTVPTGITKVIVELYGAGGGYLTGGVAGNAYGGTGGYVKCFITGLTPGANIALTIGTGGNALNGYTPTNTSFGSYATAYAGTNGSYTAPYVGTSGSGVVNTGTAIRILQQIAYPMYPTSAITIGNGKYVPIGTLGGTLNNTIYGDEPKPYNNTLTLAPGAAGASTVGAGWASGVNGAAVIQY